MKDNEEQKEKLLTRNKEPNRNFSIRNKEQRRKGQLEIRGGKIIRNKKQKGKFCN